MAGPAAGSANDVETLAESLMWIFWNLGVDVGRDIRKNSGEKFFVNPDAAMNGIGFVVERMGGEPGRVGEDAGSLFCGKAEGLFLGPLPFREFNIVSSGIHPVTRLDGAKDGTRFEEAGEFLLFLGENVFVRAFDASELRTDELGIVFVFGLFENTGFTTFEILGRAFFVPGFEVRNLAIVCVDDALVVSVVEDEGFVGREESFENVLVISQE